MGGVDASILVQQLYGSLSLADSLGMATRVCLATIPSVGEVLQVLGTFSFVASHLFSAGGRHLSAIV